MKKMNIKTKPQDIYKEYDDSVQYKLSLNLYKNVEENNKFYNDDQWSGVKATNIDKPVFNFIKPVVNFYISQIISDDITANVVLDEMEDSDLTEKVIKAELDNIYEQTKMSFKNRQLIKNMALDGDCCLYSYFDTNVKISDSVYGAIKTEIVNNTNMHFGNPINHEIQEQPYIILTQKLLTSTVKEMAKELGKDPDMVTTDTEDMIYNAVENTEKRYTTVFVKYYKKENEVGDKTVFYTKTTRNMTLVEETDLGYELYPFSWCSWETTKDSYHGVSPVTHKKANQIFVNKLYAMCMQYVKMLAFPKLIYDRTKIPKWNNNIGEAIATTGDPKNSVFSSVQPAGFNNQVMTLISTAITQTKEMMGAYDSALGNVKPDNTSAIIAVQKSATMPLELQKLDFYQLVEDTFRIWLDIMSVDYGIREVHNVDVADSQFIGIYDFNNLKDMQYRLKMDIGASSYWSELTQIQTMDNLLQYKIITDPLVYLESIPDGYIKNKNKIMESIRMQQQQQQLQQQSQATGGNVNAMQGM